MPATAILPCQANKLTTENYYQLLSVFFVLSNGSRRENKVVASAPSYKTERKKNISGSKVVGTFGNRLVRRSARRKLHSAIVEACRWSSAAGKSSSPVPRSRIARDTLLVAKFEEKNLWKVVLTTYRRAARCVEHWRLVTKKRALERQTTQTDVQKFRWRFLKLESRKIIANKGTFRQRGQGLFAQAGTEKGII